jgi:signal transduction histidine kinase
MPPTQTILIADDDAHARSLVAHALRADGRAFLEAENGRDAVALATAAPPDLTVLALALPRLSGLDLLKHLRAARATAAAPIICLASAAHRGQRVEALRAGADEVLEEPPAREELAARADLLLGRAATLAAARARVAEAERAARRKDELLDMIVHEAGNVAAGTVGYVDLALAAAPPAAVARDLEAAHACAMGLERIILNVNNIRQLEDKSVPLEPLPLDLASLLREEAAGLASFAAAREKQLDVAVDGDLPRVSADRALLGRVIENLVIDAVKRSSRGPRVALGAALAGRGRIAIFVEDEAPDHAAEARRRAFERGAGEAPRGLGLAFCRAALDALGGTITIAPRAPSGTRLVIELPLGA